MENLEDEKILLKMAKQLIMSDEISDLDLIALTYLTNIYIDNPKEHKDELTAYCISLKTQKSNILSKVY